MLAWNAFVEVPVASACQDIWSWNSNSKKHMAFTHPPLCWRLLFDNTVHSKLEIGQENCHHVWSAFATSRFLVLRCGVSISRNLFACVSESVDQHFQKGVQIFASLEHCFGSRSDYSYEFRTFYTRFAWWQIEPNALDLLLELTVLMRKEAIYMLFQIRLCWLIRLLARIKRCYEGYALRNTDE